MSDLTCQCTHPKGRHLHTNLGNVTRCYDCGCERFSPTSDSLLKEITDLIREFGKQFSRGNAKLTAHFTPSMFCEKGTIYVAHLSKLHQAGALIVDSPSIDETKDYAVIVHPETLEVIRAEFNKHSPMGPLTDNEMAYVLVVGALSEFNKTPEPPKLRHYGINTEGS